MRANAPCPAPCTPTQLPGAFMPGEFEERLKAVLKELTEPNKK